ncbi:MAG: aquaporin family protein [Robiginitomaculum sp.]|nr:MAG: aquaporin family protein [Robiginitomaculum sp.]
MTVFSLKQKLFAEAIGTCILLAVVVGSGIMAETISGGNAGIALLGNTLATGAILVVLILMFGPISGAHFNPAVTLAFWLNKDISTKHAIAYTGVQIIAAILGVWLAHFMFEQTIFQSSTHIRYGLPQGVSESLATFALVACILFIVKLRPGAVPYAVGLVITAGYWYTSSTSFANPAVTIARSLSDTFAGIRPIDVPMFIGGQFIGAVAAWGCYKAFFKAGT